jgi:hypothetical protein
MTDAYGDGWGNNNLTLTTADGKVVVGPLTLSTGFEGIAYFDSPEGVDELDAVFAAWEMDPAGSRWFDEMGWRIDKGIEQRCDWAVADEVPWPYDVLEYNTTTTKIELTSWKPCTVEARECIFPFVHEGQQYDDCTALVITGLSDDDSWCATKVDSNNEMLEFGRCTQCPDHEYISLRTADAAEAILEQQKAGELDLEQGACACS